MKKTFSLGILIASILILVSAQKTFATCELSKCPHPCICDLSSSNPDCLCPCPTGQDYSYCPVENVCCENIGCCDAGQQCTSDGHCLTGGKKTKAHPPYLLRKE